MSRFRLKPGTTHPAQALVHHPRPLDHTTSIVGLVLDSFLVYNIFIKNSRWQTITSE